MPKLNGWSFGCLAGLLLLTITFGIQFGSGDAVQCYICSWAPTENKTVVDTCSDQFFNPDIAISFKCAKGCEFVWHIDRNGGVVNFFRNCANMKVPAERKCHKSPGREISRHACTCNEDLCNGVNSGSDSVGRVTSAFLAPLAAFVGVILTASASISRKMI